MRLFAKPTEDNSVKSLADLKSSNASSSPGQNRGQSHLIKLALLANGFFLVGSVLQVLGAHRKQSWAWSIQEYPVSVLQADDDATWQTYLRQRSYESRRLLTLPTAVVPVASQPGARSHTRTRQSRHLQLIPLEEYHSLQWNYLPADTQAALHDLWHDEYTWDGDPKSQLDGWDWSELDNKEREAAIELGFDQDKWDNYQYAEESSKEDSRWQHGYSTQLKPAGTIIHPIETILDDNVTQPAVNFPNNSMAANDLDLFNSTDSIGDYSLEIWSINSSAPVRPTEWQEWSWGDLPGNVKTNLEALGYNEEIWVSQGSVYTDSITPPQTEPSTLLEFTQNAPAPKDSEGEQATDGLNTQSVASNKPGDDLNATQGDVAQNLFLQGNVLSAPDGSPPPQPPPADKPKDTTNPAATTATQSPTAPPVKTKSTAPSPFPTPSPTRRAKAPMQTDTKPTGTIPPQDFVSKSDLVDEPPVLTLFETDVTMTRIYVFFASLCFLVTGTANWVREAQVFHVWLVQGALSMMLSVLCLAYSEGGAILFRALAYHCYLLEGAFMLRLRKSIRPVDGLETLSYALWFADGLFGSSSVISIVTTYWQFVDPDAEFDLNVALAQVLSAWLWLLASVLYMVSPFILAWKAPLCKKESRNTHRSQRKREKKVPSF